MNVRYYVAGLRVPRRLYEVLGRLPGNFLWRIHGYEHGRLTR